MGSARPPVTPGVSMPLIWMPLTFSGGNVIGTERTQMRLPASLMSRHIVTALRKRALTKSTS